MMRATVTAILSAIILVGLGGTIASRAGAAATEDRLTPEQMTVMVSAPMAKVEAGDLTGGKVEFETILRATVGAAQRADLLTSFAVALATYDADVDDGHAKLDAAIRYFRDAVTEYRSGYGPDDPEVALALNTLADAERLRDPVSPPADVESLLQEASRIRSARLGSQHPETLAGMVSLAQVMGLPSRTEGQAVRIDAAIARLRQVIAADQEETDRDPIARAYFAVALVQLANGRPAEAVISTRQAIDWAKKLSSTDETACAAVVISGLRLADALDDRKLDVPAKTLVGFLSGPDAPCRGAAPGSV